MLLNDRKLACYVQTVGSVSSNIHTPAYSRAHCLTYMHTLTLTQQRHAYTHAHKHTQTYTHSQQTHKYAHTQAFPQTSTHTDTDANIHIYSHMHTQELSNVELTPIHQLFKKISLYFLMQHIKAQISWSLCLAVFKSTCTQQMTAYMYQEIAK